VLGINALSNVKPESRLIFSVGYSVTLSMMLVTTSEECGICVVPCTVVVVFWADTAPVASGTNCVVFVERPELEDIVFALLPICIEDIDGGGNESTKSLDIVRVLLVSEVLGSPEFELLTQSAFLALEICNEHKAFSDQLIYISM